MSLLDGDIVRVTLFHNVLASSDALSVFTFEYQGAEVSNAASRTAVENWIENVWHPDWADIASNEAEIVAYQMETLNPDGTVAQNVGADAFTGLVGDILNDAVPAGVAGYIQADTALPKQRGRKFIVGMANSLLTNGAWNAPTFAEMVVLATTYLASIDVATGTGDLVPGVLSRTLQTFVPFIASIVVSDIPAYQRRRKPDVGS